MLVILLALSTRALAQAYTVQQMGSLSVTKPAFISFTPSDAGAMPDLAVSSFGAGGTDAIHRMSAVDRGFIGGVPDVSLLTDQIIWPNEIQHVDPAFIGVEGDLITSGFLVPGKSTGAISFLSKANGTITKLTTDKSGYFYHRALILDLYGNGQKEILTARARIPIFGAPSGELVLLKPPPNPLDQKWEETVLASGPDVHFRVFNDEKSGRLMIVAGEFSNKRLTLFWLNPDHSLSTRVIDDLLGAPFDLELSDLNNDGHLDLLVTNHQSDSTASVLAYEIPDDPTSAPWLRHVLLTGIVTLQPGIKQASPGAAKSFFPARATAGKQKPWIVVSGDGAQKVFILSPQDENPTNWNYLSSTVLEVSSTIGEPLVYDYNQRGLANIVVPAYDINKIYFLSLVDTRTAGKTASRK